MEGGVGCYLFWSFSKRYSTFSITLVQDALSPGSCLVKAMWNDMCHKIKSASFSLCFYMNFLNDLHFS